MADPDAAHGLHHQVNERLDCAQDDSDTREIALLVTPVLPEPGSSGRAWRAYDWLTTLGRHYRTLCVLAQPGLHQSARDLDDVFDLGAALRITTGGWQRAGWVCPIAAIFTRRVVSDWVHDGNLAPRLAALQRRLSGRRVARIVVFRLYLHDVGLRLQALFPEARLELDCDDVESATRWDIAAAQWRLGRPLNALLDALGALQYRLLERRLVAAHARVWFAAQEDVETFLPTSINVALRPNRVAIPAEAVPIPADPVPLILFVGTLNYPPNEEAVQWLVQSVLPCLRRHLAGAWRLRVLGRSPDAGLRRALLDAGVELVADAAHLAPHYAEARVAVVPVFAGGGSKVKLLEALSHGRPVVATRHGVRGLAEPTRALIPQADDADRFALEIARFCRDAALAGRIGMNGRAMMLSST